MPKIRGFKTLQTAPAGVRCQEPLLPGTLLGRFEIVRQLGQGGMGIVYLAKDRDIPGDLVALKTMLLGFIPAEEMRNALVNEVQMARRLSHPNILKIFDLYKEEETTFITMEYIAGPSLRKWMSQRQEIALREICHIVTEICEGLAYAHQYMVHRDLKPENILLSPSEDSWQVKIADFGLARWKTVKTGDAPAIMGNLPYTAPEQYEEGEVDLRADIYSAGAILYELLTRHLPLGYFKPPSQFYPNLPSDVDSVLHTALAHDTNDRFPSAVHLSRALSCLTRKGQEKIPIYPEDAWQIPLKNFVTSHNGAWTCAAYRSLLHTMRRDFPQVTELAIAECIQQLRQRYAASFIYREGRQWQRWRKRLNDNHKRLLASALIDEFVIKTKGDWQEDQWVEFLQRLQREHFWPLDEAQLRETVERERQSYKKRRQYLLGILSHLKTLQLEGEHAEALELLSHLSHRGIPQEVIASLKERLTQRERLYWECLETAEVCLREKSYEKALTAFRKAFQLKPKEKKARDGISFTMAQIEREKRELIGSLQDSLLFCRQKHYDRALDALSSTAYDRSKKIQKFRDALKMKIEESGKKYEEILLSWQDERELKDLKGAGKENFLSHLKVPVADFTLGVPPALARAYQYDYALRNNLDIEITIELPGEIFLSMRLIPPGTFSMGADQRRVIMPVPFYISVYPITQEQWEAVEGSPPRIDKGPLYPVERVSWYECQHFLQNLKDISGLSSSLPTESQWEYACRSGSASHYCAEEGTLSDLAWYAENGRTHPVGQKKCNAWGIFDMQGQVWEWCEDWDTPGSTKVLKGGSAYSEAQQCYSESRLSAEPHCCSKLNGFRIVAMQVRSEWRLKS